MLARCHRRSGRRRAAQRRPKRREHSEDRARAGLVRNISTAEQEYLLVAKIFSHEPFDLAEFEEACQGSSSAARLYDAVFHTACDVIRKPTSRGWAYLKTTLQPLPKLWHEHLSASALLSSNIEEFGERLAELSSKDRSISLESKMSMLFGEDQAATMVAEVEAAPKQASHRPSYTALVKTLDSELKRVNRSGTSNSRRDLVRNAPRAPQPKLRQSIKDAMSFAVERHKWTRYEAFRLIALWAKTATAHTMAERVKVFLQEPAGATLVEVADMNVEIEQPLLRRAEALSVADLVAEDDGFRKQLDQHCYPELLKALSTSAYAELEAHLRTLMPGSLMPGARVGRLDDEAIQQPAAPPALLIDVDVESPRVVGEDSCESCAAFGLFTDMGQYAPTLEYCFR